ncbi:MAG: aminoglycoside adenylyltransferase domain-containing protein [Pyrinomonadaceae bacterium]
MAYVPVQVAALLKDLTTQLPIILGKNLLGFYLHGSLRHSSFNSKRSDVDCIVVTQRKLSDAQFRKMSAWLAQAAQSNPWAARLQVLFLIKNEVLTMNARACLYQFGVFKRGSSDGNPIIWLEVMQSGATQLGPQPESFVPTITRELLFQALQRELSYLREEICGKKASEWRNVPSYRGYAVVTVCRILYSFEHGRIVSKQQAGRWAIKNLPKKWNPIILQAFGTHDGKRPAGIPLSRIKQFIDFADVRLVSGGGGPHRSQ